MITESYNNVVNLFFNKPITNNIYYTSFGIILVVLYLFTKNRIIGLIAFNVNIAIFITTEYLRLQKSSIYDCAVNYFTNSIKLPLTKQFIENCVLLTHFICPLILFYNIKSLLRIPFKLQMYYSLLSFLLFISWTCITNDCVNMQDIYLTYDDSSCKHKVTKKLNVKIIFIMLLGNFLLPLITTIRKYK